MQKVFELSGGRSYTCNIPDFTVAQGRERLAELREFNRQQILLENRTRLVDRHYNQIADEGVIDDIDAALAELDKAAERSRTATKAVADFADSKTLLGFFCDSVDGYATLEEIPVGDMMELYRRCRRAALGVPDDPPAPAG